MTNSYKRVLVLFKTTGKISVSGTFSSKHYEKLVLGFVFGRIMMNATLRDEFLFTVGLKNWNTNGFKQYVKSEQMVFI